MSRMRIGNVSTPTESISFWSAELMLADIFIAFAKEKPSSVST